MPSPFPGMDPFLEDPQLWPDVHHALISMAREFLNIAIGPKYYVRVEERVYITNEDDPGRSMLIPDLRIGERPERKDWSVPPQDAAVEVAEPVVITTLLDDEIHEPRLEVIDRQTRHLVTVLEIVSPSNKVAASHGRASYQQKRREVLDSPCHWVEIDLLRSGAALFPRPVRRQGDYFVHVSRADKRPKGFVWPILLPQRLPVVTIPLKVEDPEVTLDLQRALDTVYDRCAYERIVDYSRPPEIPLPQPYNDWADQLLKSKNLR